MEKKQYPARVSDATYNAVMKLTHNLKVDSEFDIFTGADYDYFKDYENYRAMSLKEGFEELASAMVYPLQHDGMTEEEARLITDAMIEFDVMTLEDVEYYLQPDED